MAKKRLDTLLVERGISESRAKAQRVIRAGEVKVGGQVAAKPGSQVPANAEIELQARSRFVSRGGEKLDSALTKFGLDLQGRVAADVGASTGGFTDCLLQRGVSRVYAIDVGYGLLDWRLRNDPRVVLIERTNARYLERLPGPVDVVTIDVSFISLSLILPRAVAWLAVLGEGEQPSEPSRNHPPPCKHVVALIKPQFEAGRRDVGKGGVVRDPQVHRRVLHSVLDVAASLGLGVRGLTVSPLRGPAGNTEFLAWWQLGVEGLNADELVSTYVQRESAQ
jgi:23S rRNA (cytidine1920-2'-O)/16S rRNA (cytidine1409-2'-O)-methyltransferase